METKAAHCTDRISHISLDGDVSQIRLALDATKQWRAWPGGGDAYLIQSQLETANRYLQAFQREIPVCEQRMAAEIERQKAAAESEKRLAEIKAKSDKEVAAIKAEQEALAKKPGVVIDMTPQEVIDNTSWGKPDHINRTVNAFGASEQWVYGLGSYLYFRDGVLTSIQTTK
jgi:hypothetical protein